MNRLLLDTCAFLWWQADVARLNADARRTIQEADAEQGNVARNLVAIARRIETFSDSDGSPLRPNTHVMVTSQCVPWVHATAAPPGTPIATAIDSDGYFFVQTLEPAALIVYDGVDAIGEVALATRSVADSGHELFHAPTPSLLACVSYHPEGGEDGLVWSLPELGSRRTMDLRGGSQFTNGENVPLPWSIPLQVPRLAGVGLRLPYMHDGRAPDLQSATTEMLPISPSSVPIGPEEIASIAEYLRSL